MTTLSAADLQRKHLEGKPDPFPSLVEDSPKKFKRNGTASAPLDTDSEAAFPSLAPSTANQAKQATSAWGTSAPRIRPAVAIQNIVTDNFTLPSVDLSTAGKDNKPATLGELMKQVMTEFKKVKIEASSTQKTRQTTFHLKSESAKELEKAKRTLVSLISPKVSVILNAPASTIPTIIGHKGATLKQIRDQTNVRIDIPRRDVNAQPHVNGNGSALPVDEEEEEPTIPVTISGPQPLVLEARSMLNDIIATKTSKTTQRVREIPEHILPFIIARRSEFLAEASSPDISLTLNATEREITASGDRDSVIKVIEKIKATIELLKTDLRSFSMPLPKSQHRLLAGRAVEEILAKSKCGVIVPPPEDPSDQITVWGYQSDFPAGMTAIMQKATSKHIHEFALPGHISVSKQIVLYMTKISYSKTLANAHSVAVYLPTDSTLATTQTLKIDIVGDKSEVDAAVEQLSSFVSALDGATKEVEVDWLVHRIILGKHAKKLKQLYESHNVKLYFPEESAETSSVLLVYDPSSSSASRSPAEKASHLADVEKELLKLAKDAADVKSELIPVEEKWHSYVAGKDGTTLNAIIGEDKALSIKIGKDAGGATSDFILVRGASSDVDRAVKEIYEIVENAKSELIDNSYSVEFDINREFVGRIVGSHGSAVNKLRDTLGVRVDFSDEAEEKEKDSSKKKKTSNQKSKVKIVGRKENVEEAKRRIIAQAERLADETSEVLKVPNQYHSSLIGPSGKYVIRLEEKYSVKITFPRESNENGVGKTREPLKPDEVLVKGGKKGVAGAKAEILEVVEFEKESNNSITFSVPTKSVARILGKGGANINEIKDETGAIVDVDRSSDDPQVTQITCRGTKKAIASAKERIIAISDQVSQEANVTINIERKFHRAIIGAGGQGLRDIIVRCDGPTDPKQQSSLIRFPHQSEPADEVRLRGEPALIKKIQARLEAIAEELRSRVVLMVEIHNSQHRALIGRNGQHLNELLEGTGVQVQFPGSRSYNQAGEAENAADFKDADPQNLVKVSGARAACEKAIKDLTANIKVPVTPQELVTETVSVPLKYYHFINQQGGFFRSLRSHGVNVDRSTMPSKSAIPVRPPNGESSAARIDEADEDVPGIEWQVIPNYQDTEEGDSVWTLKARDEAGLEKAKELIADAIRQAEECSSVGFLTLPDRTAFPRIVGSKGANVARLRSETGAEITVSRENNTITIIGSESAIENAKDAVLRIVNSRSGRRGE